MKRIIIGYCCYFFTTFFSCTASVILWQIDHHLPQKFYQHDEDEPEKTKCLETIGEIITISGETPDDAEIKEIYESMRIPSHAKPVDALNIQSIVDTFKQPRKAWTILIYIAGDNDLYKFALRNIAQMQQLGSNDQINIVIYFNYRNQSGQKETRRFYVIKNGLIQIGRMVAMDSGDQDTLSNAIDFADACFPANQNAVILWNHGSGILTPKCIYRVINPSELFYYNETTKKITLDRSIDLIDYIEKRARDRGICFDNTTGNSLDDRKLLNALSHLKTLRGNKKCEVVLMDACLMASLEIAYALHDAVQYLTASQEVVLGPGYNYEKMLQPIHDSELSPSQFVHKVVEIFEKTYAAITPDYTESAFNLDFAEELGNLLEKFADTVLHFMEYDHQNIIKKTIKLCGSRTMCTNFEEPSYIDLKHFLDNILIMTSRIHIFDEKHAHFFTEISEIIQKMFSVLRKLVIKSVAGKNLPRASGISLYFPQHSIHKSFLTTIFAQKLPQWTKLLKLLVK